MASPLAYFLYIVCSMDGRGPALQIFRFDARSGAITPIDVSAKNPLHSPLFVESDRSNRFLYIADYVTEVDGVPGGAVAAFSIDPVSGKATFLNRVSSGGTVPCYVSVSPDRKFVLVANYSDGSVAMLPIKPDGSLAAPLDRDAHLRPGEKIANAHCIVFDTNDRFALSSDLGVNRIYAYKPDAQAMKLNAVTDGMPLQTKAGAGPRHLAFHPNGKFLYCQSEYDNTVIAMSYDASTGVAKIIQTESSLPPDFTMKTYGADIAVHPSGRFLYSTNRGHESIAIFGIDPETGRIKAIGHEPTQGKFPRDFTIDPMGEFLLVGNERSDTVVTFRIDATSGKLSPIGQPFAVTKPACLKLVPISESR